MNRVFVTARFWLVAGLGAGAAALLGFAGVPVAAALGGWAAACAALVVLDVSLTANPRQLEIARRTPARGVRDEPVQVLIELRNLSPRPLRGALHDSWPGHANARPSEHQRARISPGGSASSKWIPVEATPGAQARVGLTLAPKRKGAIRSNFVAVRARGPLGLAGRTAWHELPGEIAVAWSPRGILRTMAFSQRQVQDQDLAAPLLASIADSNRDTVLREFEELRLLAAEYGGQQTPKLDSSIPFANTIQRRIDGAAPDRSGRLLPLIDHLSDLFARAQQRASEQQQRLLMSRYADTLSKLTALLSNDYYGDLLRNPGYWSDPEQRIAQVLHAVAAVDDEIIENVRQLSESRDIEFQVKLESLTRPQNGAKLSDVYTDRQP